LRYLIALTYLAHAYAPEADWAAVEDGAALPREGIDAVIERMAGSWWLFHPDKPFAQVAELRGAMSKQVTAKDTADTLTERFECLVPYRPSKNNEVWWYKPDGRGLSFAEAPLVLLARHFAGLPGNEAGVLGEMKTRSEGGLMICGPQEISSLVLQGPKLSQTLVRNLVVDIVDNVSPTSALFFEEPVAGVARLRDPLYLFSAAGGAAFLLWPGSDMEVTRVLRAPVPVAKETAKAVMMAARLADPHVMRVRQPSGTPDSNNPNKGVVAFSATAAQFENVFALYKKAAGGSTGLRPCIVQRDVPVYRTKDSLNVLAGVTISGGGTWTGVRIEAVTQVALAADPLRLNDEKAHSLRVLVGRLVDSKQSCLSQLIYSVGQVMAGEGGKLGDNRRSEVSRDAQVRLWQALDDSVGDLYHQIVDASDGQAPLLLPVETRRAWIEETVAVFDQLCAPFVRAPRLRARVALHRQRLRSVLWNKLSVTS
jgi:hypothetical protein